MRDCQRRLIAARFPLHGVGRLTRWRCGAPKHRETLHVEARHCERLLVHAGVAKCWAIVNSMTVSGAASTRLLPSRPNNVTNRCMARVRAGAISLRVQPRRSEQSLSE